MRVLSEQQLLVETPEHYKHVKMQEYIHTELHRPSKQWINNVLLGVQETEYIKLNTDEFVLLPDTERVNRYWGTRTSSNANTTKSSKSNTTTLNWLAILKDKRIKTLRDLKGGHVDMLTRLRDQCLQVIQTETGINPDEVMMYVHYHPSVYQLHVHFAYPYMQHNHRDVYRIHSLNNIINNLTMKDDYYEHANMQISCTKESALYKLIKLVSA